MVEVEVAMVHPVGTRRGDIIPSALGAATSSPRTRLDHGGPPLVIPVLVLQHERIDLPEIVFLSFLSCDPDARRVRCHESVGSVARDARDGEHGLTWWDLVAHRTPLSGLRTCIPAAGAYNRTCTRSAVSEYLP